MIFHSVKRCADVRERLEASEFDSLSRQHFLDLFALIINKESDFAFISTAHEHILLF